MSDKKLVINLPVIFGLSIILAQIMMAISYYKTSSLSFPFIPLYFPIFGVAIALSLPEAFKSKFIHPKRLRGVHWRQVNFERGVSPISLVTIIP